MRLMIAEDEIELARGLKYLLEKNKYTVDMVHNGRDALDYIRCGDYDGIILDIMMPGMNGIEVLTRLRSEGITTPVMMLTAKTEIEDRVLGLESGADDYLPKPFSTREFVARVKALTRRSGNYNSDELSFGGTLLNCSSYELSYGTEKIRLNNKEFLLSELFFRNPRYVFSTERLMEIVWGQESEADTDVVWTYIGFLRKKLKEIGADVEIRTIRGAGYSLEMKTDA